MTKRQLAKALRARQIRARLLPKKIIAAHAADDDNIIADYTTCPDCRQQLVANVPRLVATCSTSAEFIDAINTALEIHKHNDQN